MTFAPPHPLYSAPVLSLDGKQGTLDGFRGSVLLIVNVAIECGLTPQYAGLQALHRRFADRGFAVLGFPCNQFGAQEPGTSDEIRQLCTHQYDVTFPLFAKVEVNGPDTHPVWQYLKRARPGILGTEAIKWSFTKFLVGRSGTVLKRFAPTDEPDAIARDIEAAVGGAAVEVPDAVP